MGLDNGIIMKLKSKKAKTAYNQLCEETGLYFESILSYEDEDEIDICYWRKFWGFRNKCHLCSSQDLLFDEEYCYLYSEEQIQKIYEILNDYTDKKYWDEEENNYIWGYFEYLPIIYRNLCNLRLLENLIQYFLKEGISFRKNNSSEDADIEVYMYDSY